MMIHRLVCDCTLTPVCVHTLGAVSAVRIDHCGSREEGVSSGTETGAFGKRNETISNIR